MRYLLAQTSGSVLLEMFVSVVTLTSMIRPVKTRALRIIAFSRSDGIAVLV
jgi:hypothetical protein